MIKIAFIDHYDSFSFNLIDWLIQDEKKVAVDYYRFDVESDIRAILARPVPLVISPGPKSPYQAKTTLAIVENLVGRVPIFGICLGHQILSVALGGRVVYSKDPHHGTTREIKLVEQTGLFRGFPPSFHAASYNSLVVDLKTLPSMLNVLAFCENDEIQAFEYRLSGGYDAFGVQFHPESFMSHCSELLRKNWLKEVEAFYRAGFLSHLKDQFSATAPLPIPS